jgi:hypothetical protein
VQARSFRQRVRAALGTSRVRVRIEKGWERSDAHLIQVACDERADLMVVGTHTAARARPHRVIFRSHEACSLRAHERRLRAPRPRRLKQTFD